MKRNFGSFMMAAAALFAAGAAFAAPTNFSFTGTFAQDDNVQLFNFTANGTSTVRLISYSYGGGTQANGNVVNEGGFDPILALFDSTGALVGQNDDAGSPTTGACGSGAVSPVPAPYDTCFDQLLGAGSYTVAVMQYDNSAIGPNLSNGFVRQGAGNFTGAFYGCSNGSFCDLFANNRTNAWAFDILNVEAAAQVPEPGTLALLGLGIAGLASMRRRKQ